MVYSSAYGLALLQLTFTIVSLMLLHSLKPLIGNISFYLSMGAIMVFGQFVSAAGINISYAFPGLDIDIGPTIFFTPLMAALLITYIVDGTLETQRMVLGIMAMVGLFFYFSFLSERQLNFPGFALNPLVPKSFLGPLLHSGRNLMMASLLSILVAFLVLPIVYQSLRNRSVGLGISVFGALIFTEVLDAFFYELVTNYSAENWWEDLRQSYLTRAFAMTWVCTLTTTYLKIRKDSDTDQQNARSALDIITTFLGTYGQTKRLQANVREWEGRYRMVVENTNDLIFLVAKSGAILDANNRAITTLGYSFEELSGKTVQSILRSNESLEINWGEIWKTLFNSTMSKDNGEKGNIIGHEWAMDTHQGDVHLLDTTITTVEIHQSQAALVVARDITHRKELEQDRAALQRQLIHSQRMEAVGKLAGGIAHDFNNLLHAIQGSLDMLDTVSAKIPKARELSSNITMAVKRASTLTGQLLGFARAGKYKVVKIDVEELIRQIEGLIRPLLGRKIKLKVAIHPDPMTVEGDFTQLEQVLLNILLNARACFGDEQGTIIFRVEPATKFTPGWLEENQRSRAENQWLKTLRENNDLAGFGFENEMREKKIKTASDDYIVFRIKDNGSGMNEKTKKRIFEPFFTTKQNKGTGMGLAMAYGCTENHNGWIHVESCLGKGSEFFVFLPSLK